MMIVSIHVASYVLRIASDWENTLQLCQIPMMISVFKHYQPVSCCQQGVTHTHIHAK